MPAEILNRKISSIDYSRLGLTWQSTIPSMEQTFAAMRAALATNCNLWNGGEYYGTFKNISLTLLNKYYDKYLDDAGKVVLKIKGATCSDLRKSKIDIFECARKRSYGELEETLRAVADLVAEGKLGGGALSEVVPCLYRAFDEWYCKSCAELNITIIAYSPICQGILTGQIKSFKDIPDKDIRKILPKFQLENFENNMNLVRELEKIAMKKRCTPAQLALGWGRSLEEGWDT